MHANHRFYIFPTVFVTGAGVMMLELLGTRIISPYFGSGLYVWSSLITVALVSLSLGYWLGGSLADRLPRADCLYMLILLSGLTTVLIPFVARPVAGTAMRLGLAPGALTSSFLLFFFPLLLLAMVTPFALKLETRELERIGATAGRLYAISTLGSFVGTILAGFVLIPQMGVRGMAWVLAAALWVVALVHFFLARRFLIGSSILLLGLLLTILHPKPRFEEGVIYQTESLYGQLKVVDVRDDRYLLLDGTPQTVIDKRTGTPLLKYTHYLKFLRLVNPEAESMLLIGLGGGSIASEFQGYGLEVDLVEIDRRMEEVARRFFGFEAKPGSVHFEDGRYYLQHTHKKYDFVLLDVYSGDAIPFHLFTSEVMSSVKSLLKPDGVLTVNLVSFVTGPNSLAAKSVYRTLKRAFPFVDVFFTQGRDRLGNVLFFASPDTIEQRMELTELEDRLDRIAVREMLERRVHFRDDEGVVLTDDYNPLEILTLGISRAWREETHAVLKTQ